MVRPGQRRGAGVHPGHLPHCAAEGMMRRSTVNTEPSGWCWRSTMRSQDVCVGAHCGASRRTWLPGG